MNNAVSTAPEFRAVPGFEGRYEVSRDGTVRRLSRDKKRRIPPTKVLAGTTQNSNNDRHRVFTFLKDGKRHYFTARQLVLKAFGETWPVDLAIYRMPPEQHANPGERNGNHKLTEDDVREIRRLGEQGWLQREIAALFNIAKGNVSFILRRETWRHIQ